MYSSVKTYLVATHHNRVVKAVLMRGHNIGHSVTKLKLSQNNVTFLYDLPLCVLIKSVKNFRPFPDHFISKVYHMLHMTILYKSLSGRKYGWLCIGHIVFVQLQMGVFLLRNILWQN